MPNFLKIPRQRREFPIQGLASDCSVCMAAICYRGPISAVPTNEQLLSEKRIGVKYQIDSIKTEELVCIYRLTDMAKFMYYYVLYFIGSPTFPSAKKGKK